MVGNGPGNPIKFYVTPVSASNVTSFNSTSSLAGDNGTYATDLTHELFIGGRSNKQSPGNDAVQRWIGQRDHLRPGPHAGPNPTTLLVRQGANVRGAAVAESRRTARREQQRQEFKPADALLIISRLLSNPGSELPEPTPGFSPPPYYDTNGDGRFNAQDALAVISWLLAHPGGADPQASPAVAPLAASSDGNEPQAAALSSAVDEANRGNRPACA